MSLPPREYDGLLAHYGVIGMHWGHRKAEPVAAPIHRISAHPDHFSDRPHPAILSDVQLRTRINRLQMERQYIQLLTADGVVTTAKGADYTKNILAKVKTANEIYNLYNSPMSQAVRKTLATLAKGTFQVAAYKIGLPIG